MNFLPLFVAIPLGMAFVTPIMAKFWKGFPDWLGNVASVSLMGLSLYALSFSRETFVYKMGGWEPVNGIPVGIYMVADGLAVVMLLIINVVGFLATLYSISYMTHYTDKGKYYTLFLLMLAGMNGVVLSGDLFNLFVFLEVTAIASYALVAYGVEAEELEASFKYQVLGGTASAVILLGIAFFYFLTGTLNLADASQVLAARGMNPAVFFIAGLFLMGFSLKAAIMPFHAWLPDAHPSAPAPISAMLSGVVIKVLGVYTLIRLFFNVFDVASIPVVLTIFLVLGTVSMVVGAFLAIGQKDFKRLLAYSSISQIGYVIFAFGLGTPLGVLGGLFHLLNHAVFKPLLFLNSGAVVYATGNRDLEKMGGLSQRMPVTGISSLVGSLSISGIPPLSGFWSKLIIVLACAEAGYYGMAAWAMFVSLMTLASFLKVQRYAFFESAKAALAGVRPAPLLMAVPMIVLAVLCLAAALLVMSGLETPAIIGPAAEVLAKGAFR